MHNNFYFLRHLSEALDQKLKGFSIVSCFSQNKEELIIELNNGLESIFIKAHLLSSFCCLSFPSQFSRAKKNSVNLFDDIILKKFVDVIQFENERSFALNFEQGYAIVFKMHANRSNVLLVRSGDILSIFRNQFKADAEIKIDGLNRKIDWTEESFIRHHDSLKQTYVTLGKEVWNFMEEKGFDKMEHAERWFLFNSTLQLLQHPRFYIIKRNNIIKLTLLPQPEVLFESEDPIEAINEFFLLHTRTAGLQGEKIVLQKKLTNSIQDWQGYITKNQKKLEEITNDSQYKLWADILMANMHQVKQGVKKIILNDFLGNPETIKLKPELNAQKNAEIFYRKAKNQEIEIKKLKEAIVQKQAEMASAQISLKKLSDVETLAEFKANFESSAKKVKKEVIVPFHQVEYMGYQILIGKNAINNDLLTLKYSYKDDLWLHAKDVSGSHVVIKHQSGKSIPKEVIERAAELAAYNSKRKTETLCPVAYTLKKFVRKRKGDLPGAVVVEREQVIMVTPKL